MPITPKITPADLLGTNKQSEQVPIIQDLIRAAQAKPLTLMVHSSPSTGVQVLVAGGEASADAVCAALRLAEQAVREEERRQLLEQLALRTKADDDPNTPV